MIDIICGMSDEKVMKLLSFAKFIESEKETELLLSDEEEGEIVGLLENDERIDGNTVSKHPSRGIYAVLQGFFQVLRMPPSFQRGFGAKIYAIIKIFIYIK